MNLRFVLRVESSIQVHNNYFYADLKHCLQESIMITQHVNAINLAVYRLYIGGTLGHKIASFVLCCEICGCYSHIFTAYQQQLPGI